MSSTGRWDLDGGAISGAGSMALNGVANWSGTSFGGGSSTSFGGALAIVGTGVHDVNAAGVTFAGTTTWTNSAAGNQGQIRTGSGAALSNTGSFIDATSASTSINANLGGGASSFANSGTYRKTGGSTTAISTLFNNSDTGTVQVDAGRLQLAGGGTSSGRFDVAAGATLEFSGGTHAVSGLSGGTGSGRVLVSAGTVNASGSNAVTGALAISGGALNTSGSFSAGAFDMSGGTLGGSGAAAIALGAGSAGSWTNGAIARSGTTTFTGPLSVGGTGVHDVSGGVLALAGTTTWTNANAGNQGQFRMGNGAVIDNSGSFLDQISAGTTINGSLGGGASSFSNTGTYTKTGTGTTTLTVAFNNAGLVNGTGTLVLANGGTHSGAFAMDEGGTVQLNSGTHSFSGSSAAGGLGRVQLVDGATATTATAMSTTGRWDLNGGTMNGVGSFTLAGVAHWTAGTQAGSGSTRFEGALALSGNGYRDVSQRSVNFAGTTTWTNASGGNVGRFRTGSGAVLTNSGSFLDQTVADTYLANELGGAMSRFDNTGSYTKGGGATTTTFYIPFNNAAGATLQVNAGRLLLVGGGTSSGTFGAAEGATLEFGGGTHNLSGLSAGPGTGRMLVSTGQVNTTGANSYGGLLALTAGTLTVGGSLQPGVFEQTGGVVNGAGTLALNGNALWTQGSQTEAGSTVFNGALALSGNSYRDVSQRSLNFAGTTTWTNAPGNNVGRFRTGNGAVLTNSGSWLDQTVADTNFANELGGAMSRFDNTGSYTKSGGATTTFHIPLNNAAGATLQVNAGRLLLPNGSSSSGVIDVASGATLEFGGGTHNLSGLSAGPGTGRMLVSTGQVNTTGANSFSGLLALTAGTLNVGGTLAPGVFEQTGGVVNGAGTLVLNGNALWTQGSQTEAGSTVFNGALALSGNSHRDVSQRSLNFAGTTTWTNAPGNNVGRFRTGNGAVLTNSGNWLDQTVADTNFANELGGAMSRFDNTGSYTKSGNATTTFYIPLNNAAGATLQVNAGRLLLPSGSSSSGVIDVASGATLEFGGGTHNLSGLSAGPGTGRMLVSTGQVNTTGANSFSGLLALADGRLNVGGTLAPGVFEQTGGIVSGAGTLVLNGNALWTQGSQTEVGSTVFNGALALSGNSYRDVSQRSLNFAGTTTWTNAPGNNVGRFRTATAPCSPTAAAGLTRPWPTPTSPTNWAAP
jgi:fibronectin-binding autotransporter adhesin